MLLERTVLRRSEPEQSQPCPGVEKTQVLLAACERVLCDLRSSLGAGLERSAVSRGGCCPRALGRPEALRGEQVHALRSTFCNAEAAEERRVHGEVIAVFW